MAITASANFDVARFSLQRHPTASQSLPSWENQDKDGCTELHRAARGGTLKSVQCLLEQNAHPNTLNNDSKTALHYAARRDASFVLTLLKAGAQLEAEDVSGNRPLHYAVKERSIDAVKCLLAHGANPNAPNQEGTTPLHYAVRHKDDTVLKILLNSGGDMEAVGTSFKFTPVLEAVYYQSRPCLQTLLARGANPHAEDDKGLTALHYASYFKDPGFIDDLLKYGADPDRFDRDQDATPLYYALLKGNPDCVLRLLTHRKSGHTQTPPASTRRVNAVVERKKGRLPIHLTTHHKTMATFELLIACGADVNGQDGEGWSALHHFVSASHLTGTRRIIQLGADVNVSNKNKLTPLHTAVTSLAEATAQIQLSQGADPNPLDETKKTFLHFAARSTKAIVGLPLSQGADPNPLDETKKTPLHFAARSAKAIVRLLLSQGADPNALDETGKTPLHIVARTKEGWPIVSDLIEAGGDVKMSDPRRRRPQTPLEVLKEAGYRGSISKFPQKNPSDKKED